MTKIVRISPESFITLFLRKENGEILLTEDGRRIVVRQIIPPEWTAIRVYDFEKQINENKREIVLVDKRYRNQVVEEFRRSVSE